MKKKITFNVEGCDYPKCNKTIFNGTIITFGCGHSCCDEHILKIKHSPFDIEKCSICKRK